MSEESTRDTTYAGELSIFLAVESVKFFCPTGAAYENDSAEAAGVVVAVGSTSPSLGWSTAARDGMTV